MGKFVPTKEWLEAAKQKPVSYGSIKFMCQLATEHMPKNDARFKYWNQLRGTILSMAKGTKCQHTGKVGTFYQRMAHDWIEKNKILEPSKRKLPKAILEKHQRYQETHSEDKLRK